MRAWATLFMYIMALPVATQGADVDVSCEPFFENSVSRCTCAINSKAVTGGTGKCPYTVGFVWFEVTEASEPPRRFCEFSDYKLGLVLTQSNIDHPDFVSCGKVNDGNPDVVTLELKLRSYEPAFTGSDFQCKMNCPCIVGRPCINKTRSGLPVTYSPDCRPGITGEKCNLTCPSDCVGGVCGRELGNCTRIPPKKPGNSGSVALYLGLSLPTLVALCGWLCWCARHTSTLLDVIDLLMGLNNCRCTAAVKATASDSDSDETVPSETLSEGQVEPEKDAPPAPDAQGIPREPLDSTASPVSKTADSTVVSVSSTTPPRGDPASPKGFLLAVQTQGDNSASVDSTTTETISTAMQGIPSESLDSTASPIAKGKGAAVIGVLMKIPFRPKAVETQDDASTYLNSETVSIASVFNSSSSLDSATSPATGSNPLQKLLNMANIGAKPKRESLTIPLPLALKRKNEYET